MSQQIAFTLATIVTILSPLALRYVNLHGVPMAAVSYIVSLVIAVAAELLTGQLHFDQASLLVVLSGSTVFWSVQQGVYQILAKTPLGNNSILWVTSPPVTAKAAVSATTPTTTATLPKDSIDKKA